MLGPMPYWNFVDWADRWTRGGRSEAKVRRVMMICGQLVAAAA